MPGAAARHPLQRRDEKGEGQKPRRKLGRPGPVSERKPRRVDPRREGLDPEIGHGAEIGDGLHHRQQRSARNGRARHGKAHPPEGAPGGLPKGAGRKKGRGRLLQEGRPGKEVDIRVKDQRQHRRRAREGPDLGEPVIARAPSGQVPQRGLNDARVIKNIRVGVGQHIGREGKGQGKGDLEKPHAGKPRHGHKPGRAGSDRDGTERDQRHQCKGRAGVAQKDGLGEVAQRLGAAKKRRQEHRDHWQHTDPGS